MYRIFIIAFILFSTPSIVNGIPFHKRATTFNQCPLADTPTLSVSLVPDPIKGRHAGFSVFGTLKNDVTPGLTLLAIEFADSTGKKILRDVYYQTFTQPFTAGSQVSITAQKVPTPKKLPSTYTIGVSIGDPVVGDPIKPLTVYGCTFAVFGGTASDLTDFPFDKIPGGNN